MGLNLDGKKAVVAEVSAQVATAQTIVVAEYNGIEVAQLTKLRAQARKSGVYLRVLKNTLVRRAVAGSPFEGLAGQMTGPLIYGISQDPVAAAKVLSDFAKANDKMVLRAGSYAGKVLDKAGVQALAAIPSRGAVGQTAWCYEGACFRICGCSGRTGKTTRRSRGMTNAATGGPI